MKLIFQSHHIFILTASSSILSKFELKCIWIEMHKVAYMVLNVNQLGKLSVFGIHIMKYCLLGQIKTRLYMCTDLQKLFVLTFIYLTCEKFESRNGHLDACGRKIIEFDWAVIYVIYLNTLSNLAINQSIDCLWFLDAL